MDVAVFESSSGGDTGCIEFKGVACDVGVYSVKDFNGFVVEDEKVIAYDVGFCVFLLNADRVVFENVVLDCCVG